MREQWAETGMGAVVIAAAAAFLIYALDSGAVGGSHGGYQVKAQFGQVGALAAGADVRVAGVKIGQVASITLNPKTFLAVTELSLDPKIKLPSDSTAKITSDGLLGGQHIVIEPGGASDNLKAGDEIQNTQGAVDIFGLVGQYLRPQQAGAPASTPAASAAPAAGSSDAAAAAASIPAGQ